MNSTVVGGGNHGIELKISDAARANTLAPATYQSWRKVTAATSGIRQIAVSQPLGCSTSAMMRRKIPPMARPTTWFRRESVKPPIYFFRRQYTPDRPRQKSGRKPEPPCTEATAAERAITRCPRREGGWVGREPMHRTANLPPFVERSAHEDKKPRREPADSQGSLRLTLD